MTQEQADAIASLLLRNGKPRGIRFNHAPFDLPSGYIGFVMEGESGHELFGGIDEEGKIST